MAKKLAEEILKKLEASGYEAYFVGGCVRDWLLNRPVHDIDICTNAHPGDVMRLFPAHVPTGLKHGTVSVKSGGMLFEVTTYRTEGKYEDYRRPSEVSFVSELRLDLMRRDFTMNAMAMDLRGKLEDPFAGLDDLKQGWIRAVGVPAERFREDALRILRAARFAAQLQFQIEPDTLRAMEETASLLIHIAIERVREELHKIIDSPAPAVGVALLCQTAALKSWPLLDRLFSAGIPHAPRLPRLAELTQKWSLLLYGSGFGAEEARQVCQVLKLSKREKETICAFVECLTELRPHWDQPREIDWRSLLLQRGWAFCQKLDGILQACWHNSAAASDVTRSLRETYEQMQVKSIQELAISGRELSVLLDKKPGQWIQHILQHLWQQTAFHRLPNTPEALLEEARKEVVRYEH
ncbi:CCA tRNA nucleotidyltransferase [Brevibacillus composti]|uniref:CCA tRNA nucleotidyltransferase n=1 Tax=Brevibacillus composti TaxID=2796470 RepID=A0A7T5EHI0_9BACL|nr:CCA tRNA nucleotidyltransferase [Brevibacillus composti]QQE72726.1 CCA tRNA nucleotidyltransferase [Brevibacillus composti]QUO39804.1 CCA tRNA nucleotidyltransferase [Brevibacillus composti]